MKKVTRCAIIKIDSEKLLKHKGGYIMCTNKNISKKMREGILIDAPFPTNMLLADEILKREGFRPSIDYLNIQTQYEHQYTEIKYRKSIFEMDAEEKNTGNKLKCFMLIIPDRYIPKKEEQQGVIRNNEDINTLYSKKEESQ